MLEREEGGYLADERSIIGGGRLLGWWPEVVFVFVFVFEVVAGSWPGGLIHLKVNY